MYYTDYSMHEVNGETIFIYHLCNEYGDAVHSCLDYDRFCSDCLLIFDYVV